jgi:hypothetical protein
MKVGKSQPHPAAAEQIQAGVLSLGHLAEDNQLPHLP